MNCPYCEEELSHHDTYYTGNHAAYIKGIIGSGYQVLGEIYKCHNEDCDAYIDNIFFHTKKNSSELFEGHPC